VGARSKHVGKTAEVDDSREMERYGNPMLVVQEKVRKQKVQGEQTELRNQGFEGQKIGEL